jgi:hypothetical protein
MSVDSGVDVPEEMPRMAEGWEVFFIGHVGTGDGKLYVFVVATDGACGMMPLIPPNYPLQVRTAILLDVSERLPEFLGARFN